MIQFIGQPDAAASEGLGGELFRIRARLKPGVSLSSLPVNGVWLNAVWATQSLSIEREPVGVSDGNPGQTFFHQRAPVLEGELLEVQEWTGRGEYWQTFVQGVPETDLRFERDPSTGDVTAVWARWQERPYLYSSGAIDRHYTLERARGRVSFGDGRQGMIPPAGSRIAVSYHSGGGLAGNVPAGTITELRTGTPFVAGATNPAPASGGAATESDESVRRRGPQRLRHRDRAVSATDFEWLAREASPEVARARCLSITGPDGHAQRGWVTVVVVPFSLDARPALTPELRRLVREHLSQRAPAALARRVRIIGPQYASIGVQAEIAPLQPGEAAAVEASVRDALNQFLHPLTGGPDGQGWNFGQTVYLSQIARVIEGAEGVDYASLIRLTVNEQIYDESAPVDVDMLASAGDHMLKLIIGEN
jgi:predicted phage baseplate assembly protein